MSLRVHFPNDNYESVPISDNQTVRDIIFNIMIKIDVPINYYQACVITKTDKDDQ